MIVKQENEMNLKKPKDFVTIGHKKTKILKTDIANNGYVMRDVTDLKDAFRQIDFDFSSDNATDNVFGKMNLFEQNNYKCKIPYVNTKCATFSEYSSSEEKTANTKEIYPRRLVSYMEIPSSLYNATDGIKIESQLVNDMIRNIKDKCVETMFSDSPETDEQPAGLLNGLSVNNVQSIEDFTNFIASGETLSNNMTLLMNPSAKAKVIANNWNLSEKMYEQLEIITDNRVKENQILMIDLSAVYVSMKRKIDVTVDKFTKASEYITPITVDVWVDWAIKDNRCLVGEVK